MKLRNKGLFLLFIILIGAIITLVSINYALASMKVEAYKVKTKDVISTIVASGKIVPNKVIDIKSPVTGKIEKIFFNENDVVKKDILLISFEKKEAINKLNEAIASKKALEISLEELYGPIINDAIENLNSLEIEKQEKEDDLKIANELYKEGAISRKQLNNTINEYEIIKSKYNLAKANFEVLQSNGIRERELKTKIEQSNISINNANLFISKHDITAPFDGSISQLYIKENEYITSGSKLLKLEDKSNYFVEISVDEKELGKLALDQRAIISSQAYPNKKMEGKVNNISPFVDEQSGTVKVKIQIDSPIKDIKTGLTVSLEIITDNLPSSIIIPNKFIFKENGINYVYLLKENTVVKKEIKEKFVTYDMTVLEKGLSNGDVILVPNDVEEGVKVSPYFEE